MFALLVQRERDDGGDGEGSDSVRLSRKLPSFHVSHLDWVLLQICQLPYLVILRAVICVCHSLSHSFAIGTSLSFLYYMLVFELSSR